MDTHSFFTEEQGNMLIRLLLAHLLSDFVFQTSRIAENKKWFSGYLYIHILTVFLCTAVLTGWWAVSALIAATHYIIDGSKQQLKERNVAGELVLFIGDQILHILVIIVIWAWKYDHLDFFESMSAFLSDYNTSLILLGYLVITTPVGYLIRITTKGMNRQEQHAGTNERGGKNIGIYERVIILTLVLLGQYEAIGFLITGKSIIRFVNKDEHIRSEYVLLGTMMSYMFAIVTGVLIKLLLSDTVPHH